MLCPRIADHTFQYIDLPHTHLPVASFLSQNGHFTDIILLERVLASQPLLLVEKLIKCAANPSLFESVPSFFTIAILFNQYFDLSFPDLSAKIRSYQIREKERAAIGAQTSISHGTHYLNSRLELGDLILIFVTSDQIASISFHLRLSAIEHLTASFTTHSPRS